VHCSGFDFNSQAIGVWDPTTNKFVGQTQYMTCLFSSDVYFDVPVPPDQYDVYIDGQPYKSVAFQEMQQQVEVDFQSYFISHTFSF